MEFFILFLYKLNYLRKSGGIHYDSTAYKTCQTHKAKTKKKISTSDLDHSHSCDRCISRTYAFHSSQKTWENINKSLDHSQLVTVNKDSNMTDYTNYAFSELILRLEVCQIVETVLILS